MLSKYFNKYMNNNVDLVYGIGRSAYHHDGGLLSYGWGEDNYGRPGSRATGAGVIDKSK